MTKKKRSYNPNPPTPLDDWDENMDPAIMSGQHWVDEENEPLEKEDIYDDVKPSEQKVTPPPGGMFMHHMHNVSYEFDPVDRVKDEEIEDKEDDSDSNTNSRS